MIALGLLRSLLAVMVIISVLEPWRYPTPGLTSLDNETREKLLSSAPNAE